MNNLKNLVSKTAICFPIISTIILGNVSANAATRIQFARGSYCGSYSGNFSGGREFVLNLGNGQTLTSRNIGGGTQYDVYVQGPSGYVSGQKVSSDQINYQIPFKGDYYIYVQSNTQYGSVEFCAY